MIVRIWRGQSTMENAGAYVRHVTERVFPSLSLIPGHRGVYLLRRETAEGIELLVLTLWESLQAIRGFAGDDVDAAVVEPEARAVLVDFDTVARHYEVVHGARCAGSAP